MRKTGLIPHNRIAVSGIPQFPGVPAILIPGALTYFGIYEEFLNGLCTDIGAHFAPPGWTLRHTGAASLCTVADLAGGGLTLTGGAADNDTVQITLGDAIGGAFWMADNREIFFETRLQHTLGGEVNIGIGLIDPAGADYLANGGAALPNADFIMFDTLDGDANWMISGNKAAAGVDENNTGIARVAATPITLGFHVYGLPLNYVCDCYVNRALIAAAQLPFASIPLTGLMPFIAQKNGWAGPDSVTVDYIMCVMNR